jgi:hypothetical protein
LGGAKILSWLDLGWCNTLAGKHFADQFDQIQTPHALKLDFKINRWTRGGGFLKKDWG